VLESFREEFEIGGRLIAFETGKVARFANGSVVISMEDTNVLATVAAAKSSDPVRDFLPLTVRPLPCPGLLLLCVFQRLSNSTGIHKTH
jgi:hypothetical protein